MLGAILGDIVGSVYERANLKTTEFPLFGPDCRLTDDTVLTVATAEAILDGGPFDDAYWNWGRRYPHAGYGGTFREWLRETSRKPYNSWGNGSAMRVSPVGWAFDTHVDVLAAAETSAAVTHNHPEGIKGAQAVALAVFLARTGASKIDIVMATAELGYEMRFTLDEIRASYRFDVSCQGSVPQAVMAFYESDSVESAIRLAISLGGDADTQAAIAGGIAEAYYGIPDHLAARARGYLPADMLAVCDAFTDRYVKGRGRAAEAAR